MNDDLIDGLKAIRSTMELTQRLNEAMSHKPAPNPNHLTPTIERKISVIEQFLATLPEWSAGGWDLLESKQLFAEQAAYVSAMREWNKKFPEFSEQVEPEHKA